jgi:F-type H+-transporting ATPase subunit alpha
MEMENKHPEILADFKKGNLPEDGLKKMTELAAHISAQYK